MDNRTENMETTDESMEDMEHEHDGSGTEWASSDVPAIQVAVEGDNESGWTVTAQIGDSFTFGSIDNVVHEDGVGHAHLVIDGQVAQMIYAPSVTIDNLEPGTHMIEVRLASSDHSDYLDGGELISGMIMIEVAGAVEPADVTIDVEFVGGVVTRDSDRVEIAVGDVVEIVVSSDVAEEIHVHGYDVMMEIPAGGSATIRFTAEVPGIFEVELEGSGELLFELVIS